MGSIVGGADYRNRSFSTNQQGMQVIRTTHTVQQSDIDQNFLNASIIWPTPFQDTFYTISCAVQDPYGDASDESYFIGNVFNVTASGFSISISLGSVSVAGNEVIIHAIAFHD